MLHVLLLALLLISTRADDCCSVVPQSTALQSLESGLQHSILALEYFKQTEEFKKVDVDTKHKAMLMRALTHTILGEHEDAQKLFETIVKAKGSSITDLRSLSRNLKLALVHSKPADTPTNPTTASSTQPAQPTVQPTAQPTVQPTVAATLKSEPVQTAPKTNSVVENTKTEVKSVDGDEETEDDDSENIAALKRLRDKLQRKKQGASGTQTEQKSKNQVEPTPAAVVNDDDINDAVHPAYEDPDMLRAESLKHEAHALAGQLKHKEAIALFSRAISLNPFHASLYLHRGAAELHFGLIGEARRSFDEARVVDPYNQDARKYLETIEREHPREFAASHPVYQPMPSSPARPVRVRHV